LESAAIVAVTAQVPVPLSAVRVVPEIEQLPDVTAYVFAPVPLYPEAESVVVPLYARLVVPAAAVIV
jgi:hypothetical protein